MTPTHLTMGELAVKAGDLPHRVLKLAKDGAFPTVRVGKLFVVKAEDLPAALDAVKNARKRKAAVA
jgi:hypothetical protein